MHYGDSQKFEALNGEARKVFVLKRSGAAGSEGYKLYGYSPEGNELNLLEDFGIAAGGTAGYASAVESREATKRIKQFLGPDWEVSMI